MGKADTEHAIYLKSDCWRCNESPTHAHHWRRIEYAEGNKAMFLCKYCLEPKEFPIIFGPYKDPF